MMTTNKAVIMFLASDQISNTQIESAQGQQAQTKPIVNLDNLFMIKEKQRQEEKEWSLQLVMFKMSATDGQTSGSIKFEFEVGEAIADDCRTKN